MVKTKRTNYDITPDMPVTLDDVRVMSVAALENFMLLVEFKCGVKKQIDVKALDLGDEFNVLFVDEELFKNIKKDGEYSFSVYWNDDLDITEVMLWFEGAEL